MWAVGREGKKTRDSGSWVRHKARLSRVLWVLCSERAAQAAERMELSWSCLQRAGSFSAGYCSACSDQVLLRFLSSALKFAWDLYWWTIYYEQVLETVLSYWRGERRAKLFSPHSSDFAEYISAKSSYPGCERCDFAALNLTGPLPVCCMGWWSAPAISLLSFLIFSEQQNIDWSQVSKSEK